MADYQYILRYAEASAPSTYYWIASTHRKNTTPGDTPASTAIPGGMRPLNFAVNILDGIDPLRQENSGERGGFGVIVIDDPSGELDYLIGKIMSGGILTILRGTQGNDVSTFSTVATMTTAGFLYDEDKKELRVRDYAWFLDTPLHDNRYGGTGGADGDAVLKGVNKPYAVGPVFNVAPLLIDQVNRIYQMSDSKVFSISDLRDGGVTASWTVTGNQSSYANLVAMVLGDNDAGTCSDLGLVKLGSLPTYGFTADFIGDCPNYSVYYRKRADIAQRVTTRAGTTVAVNAASLSALNTAQPDDTSFFWNAEITKSKALSEVMAGCLGYWYVNLAGEVVLNYLVAPTASALATYAFYADFAQPITALDTFADPRWKTTVGYKRNYAIQDPSQLAGAVDVVNLNIADGSADAVYYVVCPRAGTIKTIWTVTDGAVSTADITITAAIGVTNVTNGVVTIATAGSAAGDVDSATPSANNTVTQGQSVKFTVAGGGSGGSPRITLSIEIEGPDTTRALYEQEAQWVTAETASQRTYWPTAPEVKFQSGYIDATAAGTEATRQQTLYQGIPTGSRMLERLQATLKEDPFTLAGYLGGVIAITGYTRYGWTSPRKFILIGIEFSGDVTTKVTLLG